MAFIYFHIGVMQTIWRLNLTSFPGCSGACGNRELKLYWDIWRSSSTHCRDPNEGRHQLGLPNSARGTDNPGRCCLDGWAIQKLPSTPEEKLLCKGPKEHTLKKKQSSLSLWCSRGKWRYEGSTLLYWHPGNWVLILNSHFNVNS